MGGGAGGIGGGARISNLGVGLGHDEAAGGLVAEGGSGIVCKVGTTKRASRPLGAEDPEEADDDRKNRGKENGNP
jgi:hypothetical protein